MNDRALSGMLMIGAAAAIAWAWLTGRLDSTIERVVGASAGKRPAASPLPPPTGPGGVR